MSIKCFLVVLASALLVCQPAIGASPMVGHVDVMGAAKLNGADTPSGATVFGGDRLATESNSVAELRLVGGSNVLLPSSSAVVLEQSGESVVVNLKQGAVAVLSNNGSPAVVSAIGARIRPIANAAAVIEVAVHGKELSVLARRGSAMVEAAGKSINVEETKELHATMAVPAAASPSPAPAPSPQSTGVLGTFETWTIIVGAAAGLTGLGLGVAAFTRSSPQSCNAVSATGQITCP